MVAQLAAAGEQVRAMTRDPAAAMVPTGVPGDLLKPESVAVALTGVDRLCRLPDRVRGPNSVPEFTVEEWDAMLAPLPTVEEVTGRPARTYAQWVRDNIDEFR